MFSFPYTYSLWRMLHLQIPFTFHSKAGRRGGIRVAPATLILLCLESKGFCRNSCQASSQASLTRTLIVREAGTSGAGLLYYPELRTVMICDSSVELGNMDTLNRSRLYNQGKRGNEYWIDN